MNVNLNNDNNDYVRGFKDGKKAGVTAERERAQPVIDAFEALLNMMPKGDGLRYFHAKEEVIKGREMWREWYGVNPWQPIATAPKDGSTIEVSYDKEGKGTCLACWSENPICMLGSRTGSFPPGWATPPEADCDTNLPLDPPLMWRELTNPQK